MCPPAFRDLIPAPPTTLSRVVDVIKLIDVQYICSQNFANEEAIIQIRQQEWFVYPYDRESVGIKLVSTTDR